MEAHLRAIEADLDLGRAGRAPRPLAHLLRT
jgi:hypothetical protein